MRSNSPRSPQRDTIQHVEVFPPHCENFRANEETTKGTETGAFVVQVGPAANSLFALQIRIYSMGMGPIEIKLT